jgi:hypothetical protein
LSETDGGTQLSLRFRTTPRNSLARLILGASRRSIGHQIERVLDGYERALMKDSAGAS